MVDQKPDETKQDAAQTADEVRKRNHRNLAIALSLGAFIVLIFIVTLVRLGGSVAERSF